MSQYIHNLIGEGEHLTLDFKQSITDASKLAKTIAAFANASGGILLIGVKDNRRICGVRSEDEKYMFDLAAKFYCKPTIELEVKEWFVEGKIVLECIVLKGVQRPYYSKDMDGKWTAYTRIADQTLKLGYVALEVMKRQTEGIGTFMEYKEEERVLMKYLDQNDEISINQFRKLLGLNRWHAMRIMVDLVSMGILRYNLTEKREYYTLK